MIVSTQLESIIELAKHPMSDFVSAWDQVNPHARDLEEAKLDVAARDVAERQRILVDATVTCLHSGHTICISEKGLTGSVDSKRLRYQPSG